MSHYESLMASSFKLENYHGSKEEKIALSTLATQMLPATDISFGIDGTSKDNFSLIFNYLIGLSPEDLKENSYILVERLFKIKAEAYMDYSNARTWYLANKDAFDNAYNAVLNYIRENNPDMIPKAR